MKKRLIAVFALGLLPVIAYPQEKLTTTSRVSGAKTLIDNAATILMTISVGQADGFGGRIGYVVKCGNVVNKAKQSGSITIACDNVLGTTSCGFGTPDGVTLGDGTASIDPPVFAAVARTEEVAVTLSSNCTGITPTEMLVRWWIEGSPATVTQK